MTEKKLQKDGSSILSDDFMTSDEPFIGGYTQRPEDWVEPTMLQRLERDFDGGPDFYLVDGNPCVIWTDLDLAMTTALRLRESYIPSLYCMDSRSISKRSKRAFAKSTNCEAP